MTIDDDRDPHPPGHTPPGLSIVLITHDDEPGALEASRADGSVSIEARENAPEWAQGIAMVLTSSRLAFYQHRVSPGQLETIRSATAINLRDLDYIGVDEHGEAIEVSADPEFRMEFLANLHGVTRTDEIDGESYGPDNLILAQVEIGMDSARTSDEAAAFEFAQATMKKRAATG